MWLAPTPDRGNTALGKANPSKAIGRGPDLGGQIAEAKQPQPIHTGHQPDKQTLPRSSPGRLGAILRC
jgi:hypothetical protein